MTASNSQLGQCYVCNGAVSKKAKTCPHCGQGKPIKPEPRSLKFKLLLYFSIFSLVAPFVIASYNSPSGTSATVPQSAHNMCIKAIKSSVKNPSTLNINIFTGYAAQIASNGTILMTQTFSAKNAFGLEKTLDAHCTIHPNGKLDLRVVEQGR